MDKPTAFAQRQAADERREALNWLARRLSWENRLGELRPSEDPEATQTRRAA